MLGIDIALLVLGGAVLVGVAALIGARIDSRSRNRRRLGARNAELEKQRLEETCTVCGEPIEPARDVWADDRWWHQRCYREALG